MSQAAARWLTALARRAASIPLLAPTALLLAGLALGVVLQYAHVPKNVVDGIRAMMAGPPPRSSPWSVISTNRQQLEIRSLRVWDRSIRGGSIEQMGDFIVLASPQGRLLYLDANENVRPLNVQARMNLEALRSDPLYDDPRFDVRSLRTHDLLSVQTGPGAYDLYATFDRFSGACVDFVVARHAFRVEAERIEPVGRWQDVWTARPCLRWRDRGPLLGQPSMAGGRMARLSADEILVTVGDRHHDGYYDSEQLAMDEGNDYGKVVALNIRTGAARHFVIGLRNALGLDVDGQGRVWETENGPQGGDEINLLVEGRNYGWPIVTYGMNYGSPPRNWPFNPTFAGHDGYERPRFAFVPSIGATNVFFASAREFPHWSDSLLVGSLRANTLFVVKLEGEQVAYVEPIPLGHALRDAITLRNGQIAILADEEGVLLFLRNADLTHSAGPAGVHHSTPLPPLTHEEAVAGASDDPVAQGRSYFLAQCSQCHSLQSEVGVGPPLNGVVGRRVASVSGFGYSRALSEFGGNWSEGRLASFIDRPREVVPGTAMPVTAMPVPWAERIVDFLKTTQSNSRR